MRDNNIALTDEDLRRMAPSVFATGPAPTVSDRYSFLPTYPVVRMLRNIGLHPVRAAEGRKRAPDGREYAMHRLTFRKVNEARNWATETRELGMLIPEVSMLNSHDRTSGANFRGGLQRLVCLNGMTVMEQGLTFSVRHAGKNMADVIDGVQALTNNLGRAIEYAAAWNKIDVSLEQAVKFAEKAAEIRGGSLALDLNGLLSPRRYEDQGATLWKVFNRVQENLTRGHVFGRNAKGRIRYSRPINSVVVDEAFNRKLWTLASDLANEIRPAAVSVVVA